MNTTYARPFQCLPITRKKINRCVHLLLLVFWGCLLSACGERDHRVALGTLERDRIAHTATANEIITALPVKKGSYVTKGTVLVELDKRHQQATVNLAQAEVDKANANLDKARNGARQEDLASASAKVDAAKAAKVESEINYKRINELAKDNLASEAKLSRAVADRDTRQANLQSAKEELLKLTNGTRVEDLQVAEATLASAQALLESELKNLADLTITSTRDGVLDNLPWNLGERVTAGSPLAIVLAGKAPFARVYVPEPYRVHIKVGDKLEVHVDGLSQALIGTVRWVSSEPAFSPYYALNQEERARLMYLTEVQLPDEQVNLASGLPAQVKLP